MLKSAFDKVKAYNFIKKGLQRMCFSVSLAKFLRISVLKNTFRRLLLFGPYF